MSHSVAGIRTGQRFQRTYKTQVDVEGVATIDLRTTYIRDTIIADDTGALDTTSLLLPKIGTARAPVGKRVTIRKASNVANAIAIKPLSPDGMSTTAPAAFPGLGAGGVINVSALPASVPNSVTLEATDMALAGSVQPNPLGGKPTTAGAWMIVASSVASI